MSKRKHTAEWMIARVEDYLVGKGSYKTIAEAYGIGETTFKNWVYKYRAQRWICSAPRSAR